MLARTLRGALLAEGARPAVLAKVPTCLLLSGQPINRLLHALGPKVRWLGKKFWFQMEIDRLGS
jgi:hypothetical protein